MFSKSLLVFLYFCNLCIVGTLLVLGSNGQERKPYIVYMGELPESTLSVSLPDAHHNLLLETIGDEKIAKESMIYSYGQSFNALAARLLPHEAEILSQRENVVSVFPSNIRRLRTTRSWGSMGMPLDVERHKGVESDLIIGVFDTGIYVPSPSFNDSGYGPPPKKWKGICVKGKKFSGCNNKVIGARSFDLTNISIPEESGSPADFEGHGTHTSSTAAGTAVPNVNYKGYVKGTARGGVPSARIAAYKVCWTDSSDDTACTDANILAGFDAALHDGVDIISISIGGYARSYFEDSISIGAFHAMKKGILVVCAGGNDGPIMGKVENVSPWILTVAASTERKFQTMVKLGDGRMFMGSSIDPFSMKHMHPLLDGARAAANTGVTRFGYSDCVFQPLNPKKVKGNIIFCHGYFEQDFDIKYLGGAGAIMSHDSIKLDFARPTALPAIVISFEDGDQISRYINSNEAAKAWIQKTREIFNGTMISVASFSSRGPQIISRYILKPDISAPGIAILAATTKLSSFTSRDSLYQIESGTSMATPHVAGAAAYVKSFHPDWSPAAIKSALMTTAKPFEKHVIGAELAFGSGQLNPTQALQPGLIYDINFESYISHLCKEGYSNKNISLLAGQKVNCSSNHVIKYANKGVDGLNYPSIHIQLLNSTTNFSAVFYRTVTYVGEGKAVFRAKILHKSPDMNTILSVIVSPDTLTFTKTYEKRSFNVTLKGKFIGKEKSMYHSATLLWSDDRHTVRSPILVYREA